jgi:hypothetical protein
VFKRKFPDHFPGAINDTRLVFFGSQIDSHIKIKIAYQRFNFPFAISTAVTNAAPVLAL